MVGQSLVATVVAVLLGTEPPPGTQAGDPVLDEWQMPPSVARPPPPPEEKQPPEAPKPPAPPAPTLLGRRKPNPSFAPPDPRLGRPEVLFPALFGAGLGLGSGLFYKLALDQHMLLETNVPKTRGQVEQIARTGSTHQTVSAVLGGAALVSVGISVVMYLRAPEPKPAEPKVSLLPAPGGVVVGISGVLP